MSRLTKRYKSGIVTLDADVFMETQETIDREMQNCYPAKTAVERLAEYEEAEESGLMVRLPCKVGDTVWIVDENSNEFDGIDECRVSQVIWNGTFFALIFDKDCYGYSESYIGKTVFLTREEAGKALEARDSKNG